MGNQSRMRLAILFPFFLLLFSFETYAIGISSPYLENNTIYLIKGQSAIYTINLQNPEDIDIDVKITYDNKTARILDYKEIYTLPAGKLDTTILFNITAPKEAKIGDIFTVSYSMKPLAISGGGTLPIITGINKQFKVKIINNPNSIDMRVLWCYGAFIVVFIALLIFMWKKPKYKKYKF